MPPEAETSPSTPPDRRASLERIRAVGQTFAEGIAAIRERVSKPSPERDNGEIASPVSDEHEHRQAALEAAETRADYAETEVIRLRAENDVLRAASDKSARLLEDLRQELARLRRDVAPAADAVRLRVRLAEREKELSEVSDRTRAAEREAAEEGRRRSALERVCIGLRSKAALAEERLKDVGKLQNAELAREEAETRLAELRAEVERLRVKVGAVEVFKERAEASEKCEHGLRDKITAMDRELEQREALVQQGLVERRRLKEFLTRYEREVGEKDRKIMKLRRALRRREQVRDGSDGGTEVTLSFDRDVAAEEELVSSARSIAVGFFDLVDL